MGLAGFCFGVRRDCGARACGVGVRRDFQTGRPGVAVRREFGTDRSWVGFRRDLVASIGMWQELGGIFGPIGLG